MSNAKFTALKATVMAHSSARNWAGATAEWTVVDLEDDPNGMRSCVCGQPNLRYLFTITNQLNGATLFPIGSECINHFESSSLNEQTMVLKDLLQLRDAIDNGERIELTSKYFTRAMIRDLHEQGAFPPTAFNYNDGDRDAQFVLEMFNKHNKEAITQGQRKKIWVMLQHKIVPFVRNDPRLK